MVPGAPLIIRGGMLFDGTGQPPRENVTIVIEDERIRQIGTEPVSMTPATIIQASGLAIVPGLIDLHVHFGALLRPDTSWVPRWLWHLVLENWLAPLLLHRRLGGYLAEGDTTLRSLGDVIDAPGDVLLLRQQQALGHLRGPRLVTVGPVFTAPDGHPVGTMARGNTQVQEKSARQVTDPEIARDEVRQLIKRGVDGIKVIYDGGGGHLPRLAFPALTAIVQEAHQQGVWVAAHTGSAQEVDEVVQAGVDTVEHGARDGSVLLPETLEVMRTRQVTFVPTLVAYNWLARLRGVKRRPPFFSREVWQRMRQLIERLTPEVMRTIQENVQAAYAAGVPIGAGTDVGQPMLHRELKLLVEAGLSPEAALLAATRTAAQALHMDEMLGTIVPGKCADLVLLEGRPWEQIAAIDAIRCVIQAGRIVVKKRP
jgi:imidazolonepropionase-like amidohydrolase